MYAIVLAGGSGTRLWPLSRALMPKQLLKLNGEDSLLQQTVKRLLQTVSADHIVTITNDKQQFIVKQQLAEIDPLLIENILVEPQSKNTLPAIAWGSLVIIRRDPNAIIGVFPSDHLIQNVDAFSLALQQAQNIAATGRVVTFGIQPTYAATGYGYIQAGLELEPNSAYEINRFAEKPDFETASKYLAEGNYYWNAGMFAFQAKVLLQELEQHQPAMYQALQELSDLSDELIITQVADVFSKLPNLSIDYGIMEHSKQGAVVPVDFNWNDVGSWNSYYSVEEKDADQNVSQGEVISIDTESSLLISDKGLIAAVGMKDVVIVKTDDAVLVSPRDRVQDVKKVVSELKERNSSLIEAHNTVRRPWGEYTVLEEGPCYKIKRIAVDPGQKLSLQMHKHRAEHWVVVSGRAKVQNDEDIYEIEINESTYIPCGNKHRLENPGQEQLHIIEVQTGAYLGEDDIVRFEDNYGRK